ncbi:MAG: hypothetical protein IKK59_03540 [Lachnospiraceae bacterium]|nr:hypothetical protein [Lachnospiraceae bacterium]
MKGKLIVKNSVKILKAQMAILLALVMMSFTICAANNNISVAQSVSPRFNNVINATLSIGFNDDNVVFCSISVNQSSNGTGVSGIMKLFDSNGTCLAVWSVSDYEGIIFQEFSYQGVYRETYTATFEGYAYSNDGTPPDRLELSITDTCK